MDNRRRAEFFSTPTPVGGSPRGRFGLNGLSRHPVRILMVIGGLILLVIVFFVALLTVDGGGSDDKKTKTAGTATAGKSSTATASPGKTGATKPGSAPGQSAGAPRAGSIPATVHTGGWLVMYKGTSYQSDKVVQIKTGTAVRAFCHAEGSIAYYAGSSSKTWAQIDVEGKTGFVPAIFLDTDGDVTKQVPACTS